MLVALLMMILAYPGCTLHFNSTVMSNSTYLYVIAPNGSLTYSGKVVRVAFNTPPGIYWLKTQKDGWLKVKVVKNYTWSLKSAHELEGRYIDTLKKLSVLSVKLKILNKTLKAKTEKILNLQRKINELNTSLIALKRKVIDLKNLLGFLVGLCGGIIITLIALRRKYIF